MSHALTSGCSKTIFVFVFRTYLFLPLVMFCTCVCVCTYVSNLLFFYHTIYIPWYVGVLNGVRGENIIHRRDYCCTIYTSAIFEDVRFKSEWNMHVRYDTLSQGKISDRRRHTREATCGHGLSACPDGRRVYQRLVRVEPLSWKVKAVTKKVNYDPITHRPDHLQVDQIDHDLDHPIPRLPL